MIWRDRVGFSRTSGRSTTPAVATKSPLFFPLRPLSALAWPRHSCQSVSLSSGPAFRLPDVASPLCYLPPLLRNPTRLFCWGRRVSSTILGLLGRPHRLLWRDLPSVARPSCYGAWGRACRQSFLSKRVLNGLFIFFAFSDCRQRSWVAGVF